MTADKTAPRFFVGEWHDASELPKFGKVCVLFPKDASRFGEMTVGIMNEPNPGWWLLWEEGRQYLGKDDVTTWSYLPTPGAGVATVCEVEECPNCDFCHCDPSSVWCCVHPDGPRPEWTEWFSRPHRSRGDVYPLCPLFHVGPHVVALTAAARKRLGEGK